MRDCPRRHCFGGDCTTSRFSYGSCLPLTLYGPGYTGRSTWKALLHVTTGFGGNEYACALSGFSTYSRGQGIVIDRLDPFQSRYDGNALCNSKRRHVFQYTPLGSLHRLWFLRPTACVLLWYGITTRHSMLIRGLGVAATWRVNMS